MQCEWGVLQKFITRSRLGLRLVRVRVRVSVRAGQWIFARSPCESAHARRYLPAQDSPSKSYSLLQANSLASSEVFTSVFHRSGLLWIAVDVDHVIETVFIGRRSTTLLDISTSQDVGMWQIFARWWVICCTTSCRILLWARPLVVLYNMSVAGVRVVEFWSIDLKVRLNV